MKKSFKKALALFMCVLMMLSCANLSCFTGIDSLRAKAASDDVSLQSGAVAGDINGDGVVNNKDLTRLLKYIAGESVTVNELLLDTNGDGRVNNKDLTRLLKYVAGEDVEIFPKGCQHQMQKVDEVKATCLEDGNIAYWHCAKCGKYFSEENGSREITVEETIVNAKGHDCIEFPAIEPTYEKDGNRAYFQCSECKKYFWDRNGDNEITDINEVIISKLEKTEYSINYDIYGNFDNDSYLKSQTIDYPKTVKYASEDGVDALEKLYVPGYKFDGWYDDDNNRVMRVSKGTAKNFYLTAHWSLESYDIQYEFTDSVIPNSVKDSVKDERYSTYTVNKALVLPAPTLNGYIFAGWSDENGTIYKRVPIGTTGDKIFTANWISKRNQAWTKNKVGDPIIYEDNNMITFTYEVGEIRNVPVANIIDFGGINSGGLPFTRETTYSETVSEEFMKTYTSTVSKATTETFGWTLSNGWSKGSTVNEEWAKENGMEVEEAERICKSDSNNWYVSSGSSTTDTTITLDTKDEYSLNTSTNNTKSYDIKETGNRTDFSAEINAKIGTSRLISKTLGVEAEVGGSMKSSESDTVDTKAGTESDVGGSDQTGDVGHTGTNRTNTTSWNSESGYGASSTFSKETEMTKTISKKISEKCGYGKSYLETTDQSETTGQENSTTNSEEYSSSVSFSNVKSTEIKETVTSNGTIEGYHRWVYANTAHVFAVVGYDVESASFFTSTITVLDGNEKMYRYEDYSYKDAKYEDNQTGVISFNIPTDIAQYVAERTAESEGLVISKNGIVTEYNGEDKIVSIPKYKRIDNLDGTYTAIKVVGMKEGLFKDKSYVEAIVIPNTITEIPAHAFENCTSLKCVEFKDLESGINGKESPRLKKVGAEAFKGCTNIKYAFLDDSVTEIESNAFNGFEKIKVNVAKKDVAIAAIKSGAKQIEMNISPKCDDLKNVVLSIPETIESFTFNGNGEKFDNLVIDSDAEKTTITRVELNSSGKAPLQISSPKVVFQDIIAKAPGIALICSAETTDLSLYGESSVTSERGNAMLSRNLVLNQIGEGYTSSLTVYNNLLLCGKITNDKYIIIKGETKDIDSAKFSDYEKGVVRIIFDPNGGTISEDEKIKNVILEDQYGTMPTPNKDYNNFIGWFTEAEGGEQVFESTTVNEVKDIILYAHWTNKDLSEWTRIEDVPDGAEIVNRKYSYTQRSYTSSGSSSMTGWTKYDTKRTSWGSTQGPVYSNPSNGSRNVWSEQYVSGYGSTYYWHFYKYGNSPLDYSYTSAGGGRTYYDVKLNYYPTNASQRPVSYESGKFRWYAEGTSRWAAVYFASEGYETDSSKPIYSTRWYYQEPIYTYYFYKDENKESTSYPTGSDISNIQEWVMYREK